MDPEQQFISIVDKLSAHLGLMKEDGVTMLDVDRVALSALAHPVAQTTEAPQPAAAASKPKAQVREKAAPAANLQYAIAERMAACGDATPPELHRLIVLSESGSFQSEPGDLLIGILKAAGYELTTEPATFTETADLYQHAPRLILLMGNPAIQALRPRATVMVVAGKFKAIDGIDTLSTFDTNYILSQTGTKKAVWKSIQDMLDRIELALPDWVKKK
jgi:hypothetical protein